MILWPQRKTHDRRKGDRRAIPEPATDNSEQEQFQETQTQITMVKKKLEESKDRLDQAIDELRGKHVIR